MIVWNSQFIGDFDELLIRLVAQEFLAVDLLAIYA